MTNDQQRPTVTFKLEPCVFQNQVFQTKCSHFLYGLRETPDPNLLTI